MNLAARFYCTCIDMCCHALLCLCLILAEREEAEEEATGEGEGCQETEGLQVLRGSPHSWDHPFCSLAQEALCTVVQRAAVGKRLVWVCCMDGMACPRSHHCMENKRKIAEYNVVQAMPCIHLWKSHFPPVQHHQHVHREMSHGVHPKCVQTESS